MLSRHVATASVTTDGAFKHWAGSTPAPVVTFTTFALWTWPGYVEYLRDLNGEISETDAARLKETIFWSPDPGGINEVHSDSEGEAIVDVDTESDEEVEDDDEVEEFDHITPLMYQLWKVADQARLMERLTQEFTSFDQPAVNQVKYSSFCEILRSLGQEFGVEPAYLDLVRAGLAKRGDDLVSMEEW